eukprot:CAMPEP_0117522280 /NCGR_PEP_ID=MMETSP0784-20121206/34125_1 /TAXON_ID=39447 /ORGANISM="" /LENGTH=167 /DNA_ID=CAMNT_0005318345 /DNA_START=74 /DNA_END=577 /DNA_ORIENTATION=-
MTRAVEKMEQRNAGGHHIWGVVDIADICGKNPQTGQAIGSSSKEGLAQDVNVGAIEIPTNLRALFGDVIFHPSSNSSGSNKARTAGSDELGGHQPTYTAKKWSLGSELHGSGQCRPCAWNWKPGGCCKGSGCNFCHSCPKGELKSRRKERLLALKSQEQARGTTFSL